MMMAYQVLITDPRTLSRGTPPDPSPWVYLGTDLEQRARAGRILGEKRRVEIGGRLSAAMTALRRPFQDLIAEIGAGQEDTLGWWSSRLSWRMWTTSDLFLLTCYSSVARDLIRETESSGGKLVIVVEDPWLLKQMGGKAGLATQRMVLALLGIARRV